MNQHLVDIARSTTHRQNHPSHHTWQHVDTQHEEKTNAKGEKEPRHKVRWKERERERERETAEGRKTYETLMKR
jgi:hypothetical protein